MEFSFRGGAGTWVCIARTLAFPARAAIAGNALLLASVTMMMVHPRSFGADPAPVGEWPASSDPQGSVFARRVDLAGNLAVVANFSDLLLLDVSNPAAPVGVARIATGSIVLDVRVDGHFAYTASTTAGLQIVDISNPESPRLAGNFKSNTGSHATGIRVVGTLAYLTYSSGGLQIVDVSDAEHPVGVGSLVTSDALDVDVAGQFAYVANGDGGLVIIDIGDPRKPVRIGTFNTPGKAQGVQAVPPLVFVADEASGLRIIDATDPARPASAGVFNTAGMASSVSVVGQVAFVADGGNGCEVIDVNDPTKPMRLSGWQMPGLSALGVRVVGGYAYVCHGQAGLNILDVSEFVPPTLEIASSGGKFELALNGQTGRTYVLESTKTLPGIGTWIVEQTGVLATPRLPLSNLGISNGENRFFRFRLEP